MNEVTSLTTAMALIRGIESNQYGYGKYRERIEACFAKVMDDDMTRLAEYGLFQLAVQDEQAQDALLAAFRAGFLSPKQQKATGKPVAVPVTANVPTTARDFLSRRLDAALKAFGERHSAQLCSGISTHSLDWDWVDLMMDSDFAADYAAIAAYESRFARFIASLPYQPTAWKPVSDTLVEITIGLAEFSTIVPMPSAARFEEGQMCWIVPVPVTEPVLEPTTTTATTKAKVKATK